MMSERRKEPGGKAMSGLALAGCVAASVIVYVGFVWFDNKSFGKIFDPEHLRNIILLGGGVAGLFIAALRARAADKQAEAAHEQAEQQSRQVANVSRQIETERFTHAIEQLESKKLFLRLSAIAALERIGRDSKDDVLAVLNLLAGFVRENRPTKINYIDAIASGEPLDILESISALSRLAYQYKQFLEENDSYIELWNTQLSSPYPFSDAYFGRFNFSGASLFYRRFFSSDCHGAKFIQTNLEHAAFDNLSLEGANFSYAKLDNATFNEVDMRNVCLDYANCNMTNFQNPRNMTTEMVSKILYSEGQFPRGIPMDVDLPPPTPPI